MSDGPDQDRPLPRNLEAERSILGAILIDNGAINIAAGLLQPEDFFRRAHQQTYRTMLQLDADRRPIDFVVLVDALKQAGDLEDVGGPAYLAALTDGLPHATNIEYYAQIVVEKARMRRVIQTTQRVLADAYDGADSSYQLAQAAAERLQEVATPPKDSKPVKMGTLMVDGIERIERSMQAGGLTGVATGFTQLDDLTAGLQPEDLILVAARPSQGKTALAMNIARHVGTTTPVLVCSMEMSRQQLFLRMLASEAKVDSHRMRMGWLREDDWPKISQAMQVLDTLHIWIDDAPHLSVAEVRRRALQVRAEAGLGLIIVDYLQLMKGRGENRTQEVGSVSRGLKALAKEFHVPVLALAQLSRESEGTSKRAAREPQLSDLRESGDLENDADVVVMIYRQQPKDDEDAVITRLFVRKQRNGPTGTVNVNWSKEYVRFDNVQG